MVAAVVASGYRLEYKLSGRMENRGNHWAAYSDDFGITTYGSSTQDAEDRMARALEMMVRLLVDDGGPESVTARFAELGVHHVLLKPDEQERVRRFERLERLELPAH